MNGKTETLEREAYLEPRCPLGPPLEEGREPAQPVPLERIIRKFDELCDRRDFAAAERLLDYWLAEARQAGDRRGEFSLQNERMGFYRKQGREPEAVAAAGEALALTEAAAGADSISAATCYINVGTVYESFGHHEKALPWFRKSRPIYEAYLKDHDPRLGGLYNNMGLVLASLGRFSEANDLYSKALTVMEGTAYAPWEQAMTLLNMADAAAAELGLEAGEAQIQSLLERAEALLEAPEPPRNAYYAFICEKCAPGFAYYGWFAFAGALRERAEALYEGT